MSQKPYTTEEFNKQAKQLLDLIAKCEELENRPVSGVDKFFNEHFQIIDCRQTFITDARIPWASVL